MFLDNAGEASNVMQSKWSQMASRLSHSAKSGCSSPIPYLAF